MPSAPTTGLMTPFTTELTMLVKAAPITTATARSTTLPRIRKALKPCRTLGFFSLTAGSLLRYTGRGTDNTATYVSPWRVCPVRSYEHMTR